MRWAADQVLAQHQTGDSGGISTALVCKRAGPSDPETNANPPPAKKSTILKKAGVKTAVLPKRRKILQVDA